MNRRSAQAIKRKAGMGNLKPNAKKQVYHFPNILLVYYRRTDPRSPAHEGVNAQHRNFVLKRKWNQQKTEGVEETSVEEVARLQVRKGSTASLDKDQEMGAPIQLHGAA